MRTAEPRARPAPKTPALWLLLAHQLPARPAYLRVKIWRLLRETGAVALKGSLYALPRNDQTQKDFRRLLRTIEQGGGEAMLCEAGFVAGLSDSQARDLFNSARDAEYQTLAKALRKRTGRLRKNRDGDSKLELARARRHLTRIGRIDFFGAAGRQPVEALLALMEHSPIVRPDTGGKRPAPAEISLRPGRLWVTRQGIHVDRIACAWLIRRFIDPKAKFRFAAGKSYRHAAGELRFDMANAEFTHEGDKCSFEVLLEWSGSADAALTAIAEIIHNLDLKDGKFDRPETPGIGHIIEGICAANGDDLDRIARGSAILDDTYRRFRRTPRRR